MNYQMNRRKPILSACPECKEPKMTSSFELDAIKWQMYRITNCSNCYLWRANLFSGNSSSASSGEWSRHAKTELQAHAKDVLQPIKGTRSDGSKIINKHFVQAHGTKEIEKNYGLTRTQIERQSD